jgi:acyl-CoA dehydrogenase
VSEECLPADRLFIAQLNSQKSRWAEHPPIIDHLKARAKQLGIWNMFLPKNHFSNDGSPGFTNLEYGLMAEQLGKSPIASEACNCSAPDTGNMEVIARYGNKAQKDRWLKPLLAGEIR